MLFKRSAHSAVPTLDAWRLGKLADQENIKKRNFWFSKLLKIELWRGLGVVFAESWGVLGSIGVSWTRFGRVLGASWRVRGCLGGVLGPSWDVLGGSWEGFGESWKLSGTF